MVDTIEIREYPGKFLIRIPDGQKSGTIDAVKGLVKEMTELQKKNPGKNIQFLPLVFEYSKISKDYALNGIIAIVS